jgi:hypothetical protein
MDENIAAADFAQENAVGRVVEEGDEAQGKGASVAQLGLLLVLLQWSSLDRSFQATRYSGSDPAYAAKVLTGHRSGPRTSQ